MYRVFKYLPDNERRAAQRRENERASAYRARKRRGDLILRIELDADQLPLLVQLKLLDPTHVRDRDKVKAALLDLAGAGYRAIRNGASANPLASCSQGDQGHPTCG